MKKRLFSFLLALCMIVSVFPVMAFAAETDSGTCGPNITWTLENGTLTFSGTGEMDDDDWLDCDRPWEAYAGDITEVVIAEGITEIGQYAFRKQTKLESIEIPASVTYIGSRAFTGCKNLTEVNFVGDAPYIGYEAFVDVTATVYYPAGNATWTGKVLQDYGGSLTWTNGEDVRLPGETVPEETEPEPTEPVEIPTSGTCGENAVWNLSDDGVLTISGTGPMDDFAGMTDIPWVESRGKIKKGIIEDGITTVGDNAFSYAGKMTSVVIPDSVVSIGDSAFYKCESLTYVKIPDKVVSIGDSAFAHSALKEVKLSASLTEIGFFAFAFNELDEVDIPENVTIIGERAFWSSGALKIVFRGDAPEMGEYAFYNNWATAYYPANKSGWTESLRESCGNYLKWQAYSTEGIMAPDVTISNVASTGKIRLTWTKTVDVDHYEVYRSDSAEGPFSLKYTTEGSGYTNTGAKFGQTYYYYVVAVGTDGSTVASDVVSRPCILPAPVAEAGNVASTGKIRLTWEAVEGAVKYQIYRSTARDGSYELKYTTSGTGYTNTGAKAGEAYYYKVVAVAEDPALNSEFSAVVARTCDLARPVVTLSNKPSSGKIVISWKPVEGAASYQIYRCRIEGGVYEKIGTAKKTTTSVTDNSTTAGGKFYYKVRAIGAKSAANSAYSVPMGRVCDLAQPEITVTLNAKGKPHVTWDAVDGAVKYEIYRSTSQNGTFKRIYTASKTQFVNSGAADGVTYYYKVRAICINSSGNSALSEAKTANTAELKAPQVSITLTSKGKPRLTWSKVEGAVKYQVYRATSPNGTYSLKYTTTGTGYSNTGAVAGKTYYYKVKAVSADGTAVSEFSKMVYIGCSTVGISDCVSAREVIARINQWREYAELPALKWYDAGLDAAKIRAAELKVLPSDTERPDGSSPEALWADYGVAIELCLITQEGVSGEDLVDAMMLDEELEEFGLVCLLDIWSGAVAARCGDYWIIMFVE